MISPACPFNGGRETEADPRWHWRNCRSLGLSVAFWPLDWDLGVQRSGDVYGGETAVGFGPFVLCLYYNIGNASNRNTPWALCENEAYERARKWEARP